jgi:hypothetical protein
MRLRHSLPILAPLVLILGGCTMTDNEPPFPERDFDNHEAYQIMEQVVADAIAQLPDFPGFEQRKGSFLDCEDEGRVYDDWVAIELRYTFSLADASTELVRSQYTEIWRDYWESSGYEIVEDKWQADSGRGSLEATYPGGITT